MTPLPLNLPRPKARLGVGGHLTRGAALSPTAIVAAARQDVESRRFNKGRRSGCKRYVFLRQHVRGAISAAHLIELAIGGLYDAARTTKHETKLIYGNPGPLRAALAIADDQPQAEETNDGRA